MTATVGAVLASLEAAASPGVRDAMAPRYGIVTEKAMGVPMAAMQRIAKPLAPDHGLAAALWRRQAGTRGARSPAWSMTPGR